MRALAEAPQLLMSYTGLKYEYLMSWEHFEDDWENVKPNITFKQLPLLVVDDEHQIAQSTSIMRFIEKISRLEPEDPIVAAKADAILENAQELFRPLNPTVNFAVGEDFESKRESMITSLSMIASLIECTLIKLLLIYGSLFVCD